MKFIYLIITSIMIICCILLGVFISSTDNSIKEINEDITIINERTQTLSQEISGIKTETEEAKKILDNLQKEYDQLRITVYYKKNPTAFLTFDDGPSKYTDDILDILKQNNIKATFYCNARQLDGTSVYDSVLKRIVDEGHVIAVHSYSHDYAEIYSSKEAFFNDLDKAITILEEKSGTKINLIRLPSGTASAKSFCEKYGGSADVFRQIMEELDSRGIFVSDWNIDTNDWSSKTTAESIVSELKTTAASKLGSTYKTALVLMHNKEKSAAALPGVIAVLKELNFAFEPMQPGGYAYIQRTN